MNRNRQLPNVAEGRLSVFVVSAAAVIMMAAVPFFAVAGQKFSQSDCMWAVRWFNNSLSLFMERGYVEKISMQEEPITVYVGRQWHLLEMSQQGAFLRNFARARIITGHDPSCRIVDGNTGATVARITRQNVEILLPDGNVQVYPIQDGGTTGE